MSTGETADGPAAPGGERVQLSDTVLRLRDVSTTVEILFDDQKVWAVAENAGGTRLGGWREVSWPPGLHRYLTGSTRVTVREAASGQVLGAIEHQFGTGSGRVEVTDKRGRPVYMTKWGQASYTFDDLEPRARRRWLNTLERLLDALRDECGLPAFLSYGTLLGAVRAGAFIGHDVDADVSYVSSYEHPLDVVRESYRVERTLRASGWRVRRSSGAFLQVMHRDAGGRWRNIDIFTTFFLGDMLYEDFAVGAPLPRSAVLPLGTATLDGRTFPAPADPPAVLAATYGPGWSVPDPGFAFHVPAPTRDRLRGWFGGYKANRSEWTRSYGASRRAAVGVGSRAGSEPSALAVTLHAESPPGSFVLDVGCGDGVDALWLAAQGHEVLGLDFATSAIRVASRAAGDAAVPASFEVTNLYDTRLALARGALVARRSRPAVVLARHVLDALEPAGRRNALLLMRMALSGGGSAYVQAHATVPHGGHDGPHVYALAPDQAAAELTAHGARVSKLGSIADPSTVDGGRDETDGAHGSPYGLVATWTPEEV